MSNPIDHWKTIRIENLVLPFEFIADDIRWGRDNTVTIDVCEGDGIIGSVDGDKLKVKTVDIWGTGSGSRAYPNFIKLLERSSGYLEARLIWEDGTVEILTSIDGVVSVKAI